MRPRVFPAEDKQAITPSLPQSSASMRPRVFPAEDHQQATDAERLNALQ